jgi:hypothetical protein
MKVYIFAVAESASSGKGGVTRLGILGHNLDDDTSRGDDHRHGERKPDDVVQDTDSSAPTAYMSPVVAVGSATISTCEPSYGGGKGEGSIGCSDDATVTAADVDAAVETHEGRRRMLKPRISTYLEEDPRVVRGADGASIRRVATRAGAGRRRKEVSELRAKASSAFGVFAIDEEWARVPEFHDEWRKQMSNDEDRVVGSDAGRTVQSEEARHTNDSLMPSNVVPRPLQSPFEGAPLTTAAQHGRLNGPECPAENIVACEGINSFDVNVNSGHPKRQAESLAATSGGSRCNVMGTSRSVTDESLLSLGQQTIPVAAANYQLTFSEFMRLRGDLGPQPHTRPTERTPPTIETSPATVHGSRFHSETAALCPDTRHQCDPFDASNGTDDESIPLRLMRSASSGIMSPSSNSRSGSPHVSPHSSDEWTHVSPRAVLPSLAADRYSSKSTFSENSTSTGESRILHPRAMVETDATSQAGEQSSRRRGLQQVPSTPSDGGDNTGSGLLLSSLARQTVASMKLMNGASNNQDRGRPVGVAGAFRPHGGLQRRRQQQPRRARDVAVSRLSPTYRHEPLETLFMQRSGGCAQLSSSTIAELHGSQSYPRPMDVAAQRALTLSDAKATTSYRRALNLSPSRERVESPSPTSPQKMSSTSSPSADDFLATTQRRAPHSASIAPSKRRISASTLVGGDDMTAGVYHLGNTSVGGLSPRPAAFSTHTAPLQ